MDYPQAVGYLDAHIGLGGGHGLDRIRALLDDMGHPEQGYPIVHVAGTNGKTSTSRLATLLLVAHHLTTGTFISPHLQRLEERYAVNAVNATPEAFAGAISDVAAFADLDPTVPYTYFELITAGAFAYFADQAVHAAVVEVGLGGRLDATNVIDAEVCVVTSIGLDHTEFLGTDLAGIAAEKVAIASPGTILVSGALPEPASAVVASKVRDLGIQHRRLGTDFSVVEAERGVGGWLATIAGAEAVYEDVFLPLHGRHQLANLSLAIAGAEALLGRRLDSEAVREAVVEATVPGRMEPLSSSPLVLIDGAHNLDGVEVLVDALAEEFASVRWQLVLGVMGEKNVEAMVERLRPLVEGIVITAVDSPRAVPTGVLADRVAVLVDVPVLVAESVEEAIDMARAEAGADGAVLVTGSLYLAGEVRDLLVG